MKSRDLIGSFLDLAVARVLGHRCGLDWMPTIDYWPQYATCRIERAEGGHQEFKPSTLWEVGGPVIERYRIEVAPVVAGWTGRTTSKDGQVIEAQGRTLLIAALRALVIQHLGEEVKITI